MAEETEPSAFQTMIAGIVAEYETGVLEGELEAQMIEDSLNTDQEATATAQYYKKLRSEGVPAKAAERFTSNFLYIRNHMMVEDDDGV